MDVNNTPYFLVRTAAEFALSGTSGMRYNAVAEGLALLQNQVIRLPSTDMVRGLLEWRGASPLCVDAFGQVARLNPSRDRVEYNSGRGFHNLENGELEAVVPPAGIFVDMALGGDGRLALPFAAPDGEQGLTVFHLQRRWVESCAIATSLASFSTAEPPRVCVDNDNQIWLVSRSELVLLKGEPLPLPYEPDPTRFEPEVVNPHPLTPVWAEQPWGGLSALAITCDDTHVYILAHNAQGEQFILRRIRAERKGLALDVYPVEQGLPFLIDLAMASDRGRVVQGRLAAISPKEPNDDTFQARDCCILELESPSSGVKTSKWVRERYPMLSQAVPRFVSAMDGQLRYQAEADERFPTFDVRPRELHALRRPAYVLAATARLEQLDSGKPGTVWHRVYLDAHIPQGCSLRLSVRVAEVSGQWNQVLPVLQPAPLWIPLGSEIPFASSIADKIPGESGLFEILLQQQDGPTRRIAGRYLEIELSFEGDGKTTPVLHALRVYYHRFSYQEAYFPEYLRQERDATGPQPPGDANGADVRERLLAAFEGLLTPLEGSMAAIEQLVHPGSAPVEHLPWIGASVGVHLPSQWPDPRRRRLLREATWIQQFKGTLAAVCQALDIVTDGGVERGEVVVVENFRLRRTMATILGVLMEDDTHPLTLGTGMSGNSIIGDSLILSESDAREFLALFSEELATADEAVQVKKFFSDYAHQVTVLLHGLGARRRVLVEETLVQEMPSHVVWRVFETEHPFVLGASPLLMVDTFMDNLPKYRNVTLDHTYLGTEGILSNPAAFSPADANFGLR